MKTRSAALDAVRLFGIIAVVAGHVWDNLSLADWIYPWHVPIFFFLTGYLWNSSRGVRDEVRTRTRSLLYPYLTWFIIIFAAYVAVGLVSGSLTLSKFATPIYGGTYASRPFTTFWFITVLFATTVLFRIMARLPLLALWLIALAGMVIGEVAGPLLARAPLSLGTAIPSLIFVVAGLTARRWQPRVGQQLLVSLCLLGGSALLIAFHLAPIIVMKDGEFGNPVSMLLAVAVSYGLVLLAQAAFTVVPARVGRVVTRLALPGLLVVIVHPAVLWVLNTPAEGSVGAFALALGVPLVLGILLGYTRLSQWFTGVPRSVAVSA
jgi:acyltransferase